MNKGFVHGGRRGSDQYFITDSGITELNFLANELKTPSEYIKQIGGSSGWIRQQQTFQMLQDGFINRDDDGKMCLTDRGKELINQAEILKAITRIQPEKPVGSPRL